MGIGERIREARTEKGLTLEELGKQVGVSHASVSRWESEERTPRIEHLFRISVLLDVDLNWLVNGRKSGAAVAQ